MNSETKYLFYLGKGGVGKSTISAITAALLSDNSKVVLISLDPAHNQTDIFLKQPADGIIKIKSNLALIEVNTDKWISKYLADVETQIRNNYLYLTAFNLENNFKILKYSPGIEEYALLTAFAHLIEEFKDSDYLIFDMPPTAMALKFLSLPSISLIWIDQLIKIRKQIIEKKEMITKIKIAGTVRETDKISKNLENQKKFYRSLTDIFRNRGVTRFNLVLNEDDLSMSESVKINQKFQELNMSLSQVIVNLSMPDQENKKKIKFKNLPVFYVPKSEKKLIGLDNIREFGEKVIPGNWI